MKEIAINEKISYIACTEEPLSADIGIIRDGNQIWLYDVGSDKRSIAGLEAVYHVVLSHFHADHTGNIGKLKLRSLYVSRETQRHIHAGSVIDEDIHIGTLHIFPLPSSHCKGCLGLEIDGTHAFVGDGLYCKVKDGYFVYNAQLVKDQIDVLKNLKASILLVSHYPGLIRSKAEVIAELEQIYSLRKKDSSFISVPRN